MEVFYQSMTAVVIMGIIYLIFWIFTLVHALRATYTNDLARITWIMIVIVFQLVGPILYWIFSKDHKRFEKRPKSPTYPKKLRDDV